MKSEKKSLTFEESMTRLEEIASLLETGGVSLDETMKLYTEGAQLAADCSTKLDKAEQIISKINAKEIPSKDDKVND